MTSGGGGRLRDIYPLMLKYHHLLPDAVGQQNPWVLFALFDSAGEDTDEEYESEHLKMFYGKEV